MLLKPPFLVLLLALVSIPALAQPVHTGHISYPIADTTRAITFYHDVTVQPGAGKTPGRYLVLGFSHGSMLFTQNGIQKTVEIHMRDSASMEWIATGVGVARNKEGLGITWKYDWKPGITYQAMVTALPDSATATTIYSMYLFLPEKQQWKILASDRITPDGDYLRGLYAEHRNMHGSAAVKSDSIRTGNAWLQRRNNTWYAFSQRPVTDLARNADSLQQAAKDRAEIFAAVRNKKLDTTGSKEGVYYHILKQGEGKEVLVTDTVTVFYKGYLLSNGAIFDQTKEKPISFPLKRLIRGWQLAIPMCRVGGTVRIVIPSGLAYGIRARSKDIPPNSVLVFDVEVVDARS